MYIANKYLTLMRRGKVTRLKAHVVQPKESLQGIASMYNISWQALVHMTYQHLGTHPDYLMPGMLVIVEEVDT